MEYNWSYYYAKAQLPKDQYDKWLVRQERIMHEDKMYQESRVEPRTGARGEIYETIELCISARKAGWPKNFPLTIEEYLKSDWCKSH